MRKRLILTLALAVGVAGAVVASAALAKFGPTQVGPDGNTQAIDVQLSPKKLSKSTQTPATLRVTTKTTSTTAANGVPSPAVRAVVDFDKNMKLFTKGVATCSAERLQNVSTDAAIAACGKARVGTGTAVALLTVGATVFTQNQTITAFNGVPQGGKPSILLHTYGTSPVQVTLVLNGVISNYNKQGYGPRLDIDIPLIAGGTGALTDFQATIRKNFTYKGKRRSFVTGMCRKSPLKARGAFTFKDGVTLTATSTHACTKKR
jgi:hypothetical protein